MLTNKIICGDCLEVMKDWPDNCKVDLVVTDPPYPDGKLGYSGDTDISFLKNLSCRQLIFWSAMYPFALDYSTVHIWDKCCGGGAEYEKIYERNGQHRYHCYRCLVATNPIFARINKDIQTGHPAQKPLRLILRLVQDYSKENDLILDPFCGSGTTCVAAKMLGRKYIGIDISPEYCEIARQRLEAVDTGVPVKEQRIGQLPMFPVNE